MLRFKGKDGKVVGVLKDDASEPEGEAFKFKDVKEVEADPTKSPEAKEEEALEESEDATVE